MRSTKSPSWTDRLLGLAAQPTPPHVFALEAGDGESARLRYARFERTKGPGGELAFVEYHEEELAPGCLGRGPLGAPLRDPGVCAQALEQLLARVSVPVREASLVLPDGYVRQVFCESPPLPAEAGPREEILRFKLKRLVPFRVEELRLGTVEVPALRGQEEPLRLLVAVASEALLSQLEELFAAQGVHLGLISGAGALRLSALADPLAGHGLAALLAVEPHGYELAVLRGGEPVLLRHKRHEEEAASARALAAERELRLTRTYLDEQFGVTGLGRVLVLAPAAEEEAWSGVAQATLGGRVEVVRREHLLLEREGPPIPWQELVPMLGAAREEVA